MEGTKPIILEGTRPLTGSALPNLKPYRIGGHPAPDGASPTQPYKCGQNVKIKVKTALILTLTLKY